MTFQGSGYMSLAPRHGRGPACTPGAVLPSHLHHSLARIGAQVTGGKKGEVNLLISYPPGSFPHTGEGVIPLWDAGKGL